MTIITSKHGFPLHTQGSITDVDIMKDRFEETHNPFYVWHVIALSDLLKLEIPQWVMEYLTSVATKLYLKTDMAKSVSDEDLLTMLGFSGGSKFKGNGFADYTQWSQKYRHSVAVTILQITSKSQGKKMPLLNAYTEVANHFGISESKVEDDYREIQKWLNGEKG